MLHESTQHKRGPTVHVFSFCVFVWEEEGGPTLVEKWLGPPLVSDIMDD